MPESFFPPERVQFADFGEDPHESPLPPCYLTGLLETKAGPTPGIDLLGSSPPQPEFRFPPATRLETSFRHSGWALRRQKTWESLLRCNVGDFRLDRFRECGSGLWLRLDRAAQDLHLSCNTCRDRFCVPCGVSRAAKITAVLAEKMGESRCRFVTLTRRHSHAALADQIDSLYACFTRLRGRAFWKSNVTGGAAFLECKVGEKSGLWHVHLHIICDGGFIDQRQLSREWLAVTGDSSIVDVRAISDDLGRARYVTKYVTKPADATVFAEPARLDEMVLAMKGRRLCATFGSWRGLKLSDDEVELAAMESIGSISSLFARASGGDSDAAHWLQLARVKWPRLASLFASAGDPSG